MITLMLSPAGFFPVSFMARPRKEESSAAWAGEREIVIVTVENIAPLTRGREGGGSVDPLIRPQLLGDGGQVPEHQEVPVLADLLVGS